MNQKFYTLWRYLMFNHLPFAVLRRPAQSYSALRHTPASHTFPCRTAPSRTLPHSFTPSHTPPPLSCTILQVNINSDNKKRPEMFCLQDLLLLKLQSRCLGSSLEPNDWVDTVLVLVIYLVLLKTVRQNQFYITKATGENTHTSGLYKQMKIQFFYRNKINKIILRILLQS